MRYLAIFLMVICAASAAFGDGEIHVPYWSGSTLYMIRHQPNGDVFLSDGLGDEVHGTGGRDADDYDIPMTESGGSGHYVGNFDTLTNIGAGIYYFDIFVQAGGSPADSDQPAGFWGSIRWTGTAEDLGATAAALTAHDGKLDTVDANVDAILVDTSTTLDDHLTDIKGTSFVKDTHSLIDIWTLVDWLRDVTEGDTWTNTSTTPWRMEVRTKGTASALINKELFKVLGGDITAENQRIGQKTEP